MIEFDVDMEYLLEEGELDCVVLNDENGEYEPIEFEPKFEDETCELVETDRYSSASETIHVLECSACGKTCEHVNGAYSFCPNCGAKVVSA